MSLSKENKVIIDGQTYYGGLNQPNLKFIKVNVDCWERIFDFLSLRDILAMSQTCQRMRQIGGHYFCEKFHGTQCCWNGSGLMMNGVISMERDDFLRFVDTYGTIEKLNHLRIWSSKGLMSSLTTLDLFSVDLNKHQLHGFENIQSNIDTIKLTLCSIDDNWASEFFSTCPKLKFLLFRYMRSISTTAKASLFQRTYPMLERIDFYKSGSEIMNELMPFLERNPNIKSLGIGRRDLRKIPPHTSTIHLNYLDIEITSVSNATKLFNHLKTLHANGFFKKLRLSMYNVFDSEPYVREMILFDALEAFFTWDFYTNAMNNLTQLEELHMMQLDRQTNLDEMAMNLINLERLCIYGTVDQLKSFLRHSKKLKFVIFSNQVDGSNALNLFNLNRVREMSGVRRTVQIGVYEKQYLATKWNEKGVNYDMVEITRSETIRKHFDYQN